MASLRKEEVDFSEASLVDEYVVVLDDKGWNQLVKADERPQRELTVIGELLRRKAPWE